MLDNQHNGATPWTPGPWETYPVRSMVGRPLVHSVAKPIDGSPVQVAQAFDIDPACWEGVGDTDANAALIALAPEMAEAILGIAGSHHLYLHAGQHDPCPAEICRMAKKLRALSRETTTKETTNAT